MRGGKTVSESFGVLAIENIFKCSVNTFCNAESSAKGAPMSDARQIKELLRQRVAELAQYLLPNGHREGNHWRVGNIEGEPGKSFDICISGEKAGLWGDFAESGKHSRSLLDLWMHARNVDFKTALREAAEWLDQSLNWPNCLVQSASTTSSTSTFRTLDDAIVSTERRLNMPATRRDWYHDRNGNEHFVVVRFDGDNTKDFRPFCRNGSAWIVADPPGKLPLFRLPELIARPGELVFIVEGEKCACELATLGLLVTTSAHGANSAHKTDWQPLAGREVVILPDNDAEGRGYAHTGAAILNRLSPPAAVRIVKLFVRAKGDCVDWLDARDARTPEEITAELLGLVKSAGVIREAVKGKSESANLAEITEAPPFPLHCLPPACEAMATRSAKRCACGIASRLLYSWDPKRGNWHGLQVTSGANRVTRGNLYILSSAESGSGKSETFRHLAKPFLQFEAERLEAWKVETVPGLLAEQEFLKAKSPS